MAGYRYLELTCELVLALWSVPRIDPDGTTPVEGGELVTFELKHYGGYLDLKFEPPFLSRSYLALRGERLSFLPYIDPQTGATERREEGITRVCIAVGYKVARPVLLKVALSKQVEDGEPLSFDGYAWRAFLIASF